MTLSSEDEEEFDDILEEESNAQHGRSIGSLTITEDGVKMDSISTEFNKNQNVELKLLDDGVLEFTVLQEHSTPGVRVSQILDFPVGVYELTVVGNTLATGTFFPFRMIAFPCSPIFLQNSASSSAMARAVCRPMAIFSGISSV